MDFFLCLICGLDPSKKYLSNEAYMCPNCYTPAVHHVKLSTKFSLFCIPLFPIKKGKRYYLCDRCNWASSEGPPQFVQRPPPPPGLAPAGHPGGPAPPAPPCPSCGQPLPGQSFQFCPHCGSHLVK